MQIPAAAGTFINAVQAGSDLGTAATDAALIDAEFDLVGILGLLLQKSAISALYSPRRLS